MELGDLVFTLEGWQAVLAVFGPLLVGFLTSLTTTSKVKAIIAIVVIVATTVVQALLVGGWTNDVFGNLLSIVAVWQTCYMFWKSVGLTSFLQEEIPIQLFAVEEG